MRMLFLILGFMLSLPVGASFAQAQTSRYGIPATTQGVTGSVGLPVTTVAQLPTCDVSHVGVIRAVSDANSTTYNATAAGGSTNVMIVFCNGTAWKLQ